jgi:hypothetical protein
MYIYTLTTIESSEHGRDDDVLCSQSRSYGLVTLSRFNA